MAPSWMVFPWYEVAVPPPVVLVPPQAASASANAIVIPRAALLINLSLLSLPKESAHSLSGSRGVSRRPVLRPWRGPLRRPRLLEAGAAELESRQGPTLSEDPTAAIGADELLLGHSSLTARAELAQQPPTGRIFELLGRVGQVGDEGLEVEVVPASAVPQPHPVVLDLGVDRLTLLVRSEEPEGDTPAQLGLALPCLHRDLYVIGIDGVLACQVPDFQPQRIRPNAGHDPGVEGEPTPRPADALLARLPFLQDLQRGHGPPNAHAPCVPTGEPTARRWQTVQGVVEAGLVVDLVGAEMGNDVLDTPAAAVAARRPSALVETAQVRAKPPDLAVIRRERVSAP